MPKPILDQLAQGIILGDGGYLLELEKRGYVRAGPFTPEVSVTHPEALAQLHREFMRAGAEVLQTMTFYASEDKLATVGLQGKVQEINRAAVRIARQVAAEGDVLVAGNLSLTWAYDPKDPVSPDRVRKLFDAQLAVMVEEGVDFIIAETFSWLGEALIATERIKKAGLVAMVTLSYEQNPHTYEGDTPADGARKLADAGAEIVGVNCLRNPEYTLPLMKEMRAATSAYIACQPAAYHTPQDHVDFTSLPEFPTLLDPLQLNRKEMAEYATKAREMGINYIGACCGAVASHIREMAFALGKLAPDNRLWSISDKPMSAYEYYQHATLAR
jgi:betaine-homocysteine S-methyltransferase